MSEAPAHPLVFRLAPLWPAQLARVEMHRRRAGGDLSHVAPLRSGQNRFLVGGAGWHETLVADIRRASQLNQRQAYAARRRLGRRKEAEAIRRNGPGDPWAGTREHGPMREFVLTANAAFFAGEVPGFEDEARVAAFRAAALRFITEQFGAGCVAAWEDRDEQTFHVHGVVAPWVESETKKGGRQRTLRPASIPVIKSYERGQTIAAGYFAHLGLVRGEQTAATRREARDAERETGLPRAHTPCHVWRAEEARRVMENRRAAEAARAEAEARARRAQASEEAAAEMYEAAEARSAECTAMEARLRRREETVEAREARIAQRERDIGRRERWLREAVGGLLDLGARIRSAAQRLGLADAPAVSAGLHAADRLDALGRGAGAADRHPRPRAPAPGRSR